MASKSVSVMGNILGKRSCDYLIYMHALLHIQYRLYASAVKIEWGISWLLVAIKC